VTSPRPTRRFAVHALVAGGALLAAVVFRAGNLVLLAAPSVVLLMLGIAWRPAGRFEVTVDLDAPRMVEGDRTTVRVCLRSDVAATVTAAVDLPTFLTPLGATAARVTLTPGTPVGLDVPVAAVRWAGGTVGPVRIREASPGGLIAATSVVAPRVPVRVLPMPVGATHLVRPEHTHVGTGNRTSRARASGLEFAEVRPYVAGDRARDVNWRATVRRGTPWVTDRHPDRRVDVVLLVDAFDANHLDDVLRGALALAQGYLAAQDRVGVTSVGGVMRWLAPGSGASHRLLITEALLDTQVLESYATPNVTTLSAHTMPPGALVLVLTPATDPRTVTVAEALRARGRDVAVIVLEPAPPAPHDDFGRLANRLLALQRRAARDRLHARSLAAVAWDPATPVDGPMAELQRWRRAPAVAP
jgi:uncharacterized protein (DUF58 family)